MISDTATLTSSETEQPGYGYNAAGNLHLRTNNALIQTFNVNDLNELTTASRSGTLTVEGTTTSQATNVTVNSYTAALYSDYTFAKDGFTPANGTNIFTAIARDNYGRSDTNVSISYLPSSISYTYDANGNLTSDGRRCFAYDDENQLISVWVTNVWRSDFAYDGKMRRRIRREYLWQSAIWNLQSEIHYLYDGNLVIQERDANNLPLVTYTRGKDLSGSLEGAGGIGGLLARTDSRLWALDSGLGTAHAYYHADGNGNITCLINVNQVIVAHYVYDPYGNILSQSGPLAEANLYRFSSKVFHAASGLVYYLYRFYEPSLQRWLNRDPIGEIGGDNLFDSFQNNPIKYYDPDGRVPIPVLIRAGRILLSLGYLGISLYQLNAFFDCLIKQEEINSNARKKLDAEQYECWRSKAGNPDQCWELLGGALDDGAKSVFFFAIRALLIKAGINPVTAQPW